MKTVVNEMVAMLRERIARREIVSLDQVEDAVRDRMPGARSREVHAVLDRIVAELQDVAVRRDRSAVHPALLKTYMRAEPGAEN